MFIWCYLLGCWSTTVCLAARLGYSNRRPLLGKSLSRAKVWLSWCRLGICQRRPQQRRPQRATVLVGELVLAGDGLSVGVGLFVGDGEGVLEGVGVGEGVAWKRVQPFAVRRTRNSCPFAVK